MSSTDLDNVLENVMKVMGDLADEWEYSGPITPNTRFFADMEVRSLDFVILSTAMVKLYGRLPFDQFYTELSESPPEEREVTVREYAEFVRRHLMASH